MKLFIYSLLILCCACSSPIKLYNLDESACAKLAFGQIETRRMLNDVDKANLAKEGLIIQDFIFENIYQGVWKHQFGKKNLDKTPIIKLTPIGPEQKIAGGKSISEIDQQENKNVVLILQTIGPMAPESLSEYGKITAEKNSFIKMETGIKNALDLSNHPCIKNISILEPDFTPDFNKD